MSEIKVNSIKGVGASAAAITVNNTDGTCTANITNNLSNRNLIINGAMQVAQRGTSSTSAGHVVDRVEGEFTSLDESPTYAQVDVASGTTPYTLGFRKALKITNGNQTSGAGAGQRYQLFLKLEGQDVANSGWNYTSSSSYITLSFWVKSSVAQNFYGYLRAKDGTGQRYCFETGSLTADTWTKITKTIPGNSNLQIDNDTGEGLQINLNQYFGTDYTDSGVSLNTWGAYASGTRTPVQTSTWYTTNDATYEITGVQLEVGSTATDFEHRSFAVEKALCQRYCVQWDSDQQLGIGQVYSGSGYVMLPIALPCEMRAKPSVSKNGSYWFVSYHGNSGYAGDRAVTVESNAGAVPNAFMYRLFVNGGSNQGNATTVWCLIHDSANQYLRLEAEL